MFFKLGAAFTRTMLHVLCPPFCVHCKQWLSERSILCETCFSLIQPLASTKIIITKNFSMTVLALSSYQEPIKTLVLAKITAQRLASMQLGELIWAHTPLSSVPFDYIVPIPLHWTRYAKRGYNQAEVMAATIGKKSGKKVMNALQRNRRTVFQSSLPIEQRESNVQHVFSITKNNCALITNKHILLVDDLMTTGSTLKEAAKELLHGKPASITAVVACRTV